MAIWSMNAAAVNCWRAEIWVLDGVGSWSGRAEGKAVELLLWTMVVS